ncbi:MAG TPA: multiheme c-type cytochrome [Chitinophagaceae bacterium]|nr:multiheme c-type cytochrome [Chitinophagaceae bacterium]
MKQNRKALLLVCVLCIAVIFLSRCVTDPHPGKDPRGPGFAGSSQCRQCHQAVYDAYLASAHFNTTQPASRENIKGSFANGSNRFRYNDSTYVLMQERDSGLYQVAYVNDRETAAHRFDILFGTKHAQTFLYWQGNRTYELPVSYYMGVQSWGTSPGFSHTNINFKRFIGANCFECHSTYIARELKASTAGIEEDLHKNTLVYGIDCERCHGPALNHVNFHTSNPQSKQAKHIVRISTLTRQQKLDVCAVCHSGNNKMQEKSTFRFRPGDTLAHYFTIWPTGDTSTSFDVHGNQYQLLSQSACFIKTNSLDCSTCHNPHTDAGNNLKMYSTICANCHTSVAHSFAADAVAEQQLKNNCIDCHMPSQPSQAITFFLADSTRKSAYFLRTHKIGIYDKPK